MKPPPSLLLRRDFLRNAGLGLAGTWMAGNLLACEDGSAAPQDDAMPDGPPDGMPPTCGEVTAANIEGPFFEPNSPLRADLTEPAMLGTRIEISGVVYSATTCQPIPDAMLDFWSADHQGAYDEVALRGHQLTNANGEYALTSVLPGHYLNGAQFRPAHLHVKAAAPGHRMLTTQLYFSGDPFNDKDPFIVPSLIMETTEQEGVLRATFHFVLASQ